MIKAIILDFDGVIVESVDIKTRAFRELFSRYTEDITPIMNYHLQHNAISRFIKFQHIWEQILQRKYDSAIQEKLGRQFSEIVLDRVINCPFVSGALDFLQQFYKKVPLYIASSVPEEELVLIIDKKKLGNYFSGVYGFPPVKKSQAIIDIMQKESISAQELLYIGDSLEDLKAAADAGTVFIARRNKEDFNSKRVPVFDDMHGVANYVIKNVEIDHESPRKIKEHYS